MKDRQQHHHTDDATADDMLTEVVLIVDRSGSMGGIRRDMEEGIWSLILEQHGAPGRCTVSLYTFDNSFETSFVGRASGDVQHRDCAINPRGSTALFDAVVQGLSDTERRVRESPEDGRPDLVTVVVVTDGRENASTECSLEDVRRAVKRATSELEWTFTFLAADMAGFSEGRAFTRGLDGASAQYFSRECTDRTARTLSSDLLRMRRERRDRFRSPSRPEDGEGGSRG